MSGFGYGAQFQEKPFLKVSRIIGMLFISMLIGFKKTIKRIGRAVLPGVLSAMFFAFFPSILVFFRDTDKKNFEFSKQALFFYWAILGLFFFVFL